MLAIKGGVGFIIIIFLIILVIFCEILLTFHFHIVKLFGILKVTFDMHHFVSQIQLNVME